MQLSWRRLFSVLGVIVAAFASMPRSSANEHSGCAGLNNISNNRVGIFEIVGTTGELKWVQDVPTGGVGRNGGYLSIPQIVSTHHEDGRACIFAANAATNNVTALQITLEQEPGAPCNCNTKVVGSPVSIGVASSFGSLGAGLAVTPDGKALYSANPGSSDITRFAVGTGCALTALAETRIPAPLSPADIEVKPDGRCLAVSSPETDSIAMYRIGVDHALAPAGRYPVPGPGQATGVEFTGRVAKDSLYVSKAANGQLVIVRYEVTESCRLAPLPTITTLATGRTSNVARLDPENRCLFAPSHAASLLAVNHPPSTLTSFSVDPMTGALTQAATVDDVAFFPAGLDFGKTFDGDRFLYYTSFTREIFRRPLKGCEAGAVVRPGVPAAEATSLQNLPSTGPLRTLTIIQ